MAIRSVDSSDLVELPRMNAREILALARALVTLAKPHRKQLPAFVVEALDEFEEALGPLEEALGPAPSETTVADVRAADREEDNAVGALVEFLSAFSRLPARFENAAPARAALAILKDGDGLKYLTYKPVVEWSEVETRRKALVKGGHVETIRAMGGGDFLAYLDEAHKNYGIAAGTTAPLNRPETVSVEEPRAALADAMRAYVVRVTGMVSRKKPETRERAETLLRPLMEWKSSTSAPAAEPAAPAAPVEPAKPSDG